MNEKTNPNESTCDNDHHTITVVVNGRPKQVQKTKLSFRDVVALAYENPAFGDLICYTVTFKRGHGNKPEGTLVEGEFLKPKKDMVINVLRTDKS